MKSPDRIALLGALALALSACSDPSPPAGQEANTAPPAPAPGPVAAPQQQEQAPAATIAADMALSRKVKQALPAQAGGGHVEVAASDGVVTLFGTVEAPAEKERVALAAMNVEGVRSVVNNLVVVRGS